MNVKVCFNIYVGLNYLPIPYRVPTVTNILLSTNFYIYKNPLAEFIDIESISSAAVNIIINIIRYDIESISSAKYHSCL